MNLQQLFKMQQQLDSHIAENHQLSNKNLFHEKTLALLVELGELANETRCFKFWSLKPASERQVILEEFVDGVHFMLSLGLDCNFETEVTAITVEETNNENITDQFLKVFSAIEQFKTNHTIAKYNNMLTKFFTLGNMLGFSSEDVYDAYIKKNEVNFQRQEKGY